MRYLILSDIHANWEALEAVLQAAEGEYDQIVCCGDFIGYGADPNAVAEWAKQNVTAAIRGNHDRAGIDLEGLEWFNPMARAATIWTHRELTPANADYIRGLPKGPMQVGDFTLVHGSALNEDEYVVNVPEASEAFAYQGTRVTFFGHTHLQGGFEWRRRKVGRVTSPGNPTMLDIHPDNAYLVNPGSVGQPRDENPDAAYILYDPDDGYLVYHRAAYDVDKAQAKIRAAGLPSLLADRLAFGR